MSEIYVPSDKVSVLNADFAQRHFHTAIKMAGETDQYMAAVKRYSRAAQDLLINPTNQPLLAGFLQRLPFEMRELMDNAPARDEMGVYGIMNEIMQVLFKVNGTPERVAQEPALHEATYATWRAMITACSRMSMLNGTMIDNTRRELGNQRHEEADAIAILRALNRATINFPGQQENMLRSLILNPSELPGMVKGADISSDHYDEVTISLLSEASASVKKTLSKNIEDWIRQMVFREKFDQAVRLIAFLPVVEYPTGLRGQMVVRDSDNKDKRIMAIIYADQQFADIQSPVSLRLRDNDEGEPRIGFLLNGKHYDWDAAWALGETLKDPRGRSIADRVHNFILRAQDDMLPIPGSVMEVDGVVTPTFGRAARKLAKAEAPKAGFEFGQASNVTELPTSYESWNPDLSGANGDAARRAAEKAQRMAARAADKSDLPEEGATILAFPAGPQKQGPA